MLSRGKKKETYNSRYSLVITDPTTSQPLTSLTRGERTGSRIFWWVWSYVFGYSLTLLYITHLLLISWVLGRTKLSPPDLAT
jgi:hypothetical protein